MTPEQIKGLIPPPVRPATGKLYTEHQLIATVQAALAQQASKTTADGDLRQLRSDIAEFRSKWQIWAGFNEDRILQACEALTGEAEALRRLFGVTDAQADGNSYYDLFEDICANIKFGKLTRAEEHKQLSRLLYFQLRPDVKPNDNAGSAEEYHKALAAPTAEWDCKADNDEWLSEQYGLAPLSEISACPHCGGPIDANPDVQPKGMVEVPDGLSRSDAEFWLRKRGEIIEALRAEGMSIVTTAHGVQLWRLGKIDAATASQAPAVAHGPMTAEQQRDLVKECGLDWHRGFIPLFDDDPTNRFAVLIEAVEAHHGIGTFGVPVQPKEGE